MNVLAAGFTRRFFLFSVCISILPNSDIILVWGAMKRLLPWVSIFLVGLVVGVTLTDAQPTAKNPAGTVPNTVVVK